MLTPSRRWSRIVLHAEVLEDRCVPSSTLPLDLGADLDGDELFADPLFGSSNGTNGKKAPLPSPQVGSNTGGGQASTPVAGMGGQTPDSTPALAEQFRGAMNAINQGNVGSIADQPGPIAQSAMSGSAAVSTAASKTLAPKPQAVIYSGVLTKFSGLAGYNYYPPDSNAAASSTTVINTVNQVIGIWNTAGVFQSSVPFSTFWSSLPNAGQTPGPHSAFAGFSDPVVAFDDNSGLFIVGDQYVDPTNGTSVQDVAISKTATPTTAASSWTMWQFNTGESGGQWADFPGKLGFNHDAIAFTFNLFSGFNFTHAQVDVLNKAALMSGAGGTVPGADLNQFDVANFFTLSAASMHASTTGDPLYFLTNAPYTTTGYGNTIDLVTLASPLSNKTPTFQKISVNSFTPAIGERLNAQEIDSRMLSASERGGFLVAAQTVVPTGGSHDEVQWYEINVNTLGLQEGDIAATNPGGDTYYPAIDIDPTMDLGVTFVQSIGTLGSPVAPGQYPSMYITGRLPADVAGTMETPQLVFAGTGDNPNNPNNARGGDIASVTVDPLGNFWACNEYISNSGALWNQGIVEFDVKNAQPALNPIAAGTLVEGSGQTTVTLTGDNFIVGTVAYINGIAVPTTVINSTTMTITVPAADDAEEGSLSVQVKNSAGTSLAQTLLVADAPFNSVTATSPNLGLGTPLSNVLIANFIDPGTDGTTKDYTATVTISDSAGVVHTITGVVKGLGGKQFGVYISTTFAFTKFGLYPYQVTIKDVGGTTATVSSDVQIIPNTGIFFTDGNNQLWIFFNGKYVNTGGFATRFSAGVDAKGLPECYFFDGNNELWRYDNGVFTPLGAFGMKLAAGSGQVAFTDGNNQLWLYKDGVGFTFTGAFVKLLTAGFDSGGNNYVGFTDGTNHIWQVNPNGVIFNTGLFGTRISSGQDTTGQFEIWFTDGNNRIWRYDNGFNGTINAFGYQIQGGSNGTIYFLDANNGLFTSNDAGVTTNTLAFGTQIAASPGLNAVFFTDGINQMWEYQNGIFTALGAFGVKMSVF
jgi:hypothetical protein